MAPRRALWALIAGCLCACGSTALAARGAVASLVLEAIHSTLREGECAERALKRALRRGRATGAVESADCRAAVASAVFGVATLRARLAHTLARCWADGPVPRPAEAQMLALWLLLEEPQRASIEAIRSYLPVESLGLPHEVLARLLEATPPDEDDEGEHAPVPRALVPRYASRFSLPCSLVRPWSSQLQPQELASLARCCNSPGKVWLRCNTAVRSIADTESALADAGVRTRRGAYSPWALELLGTRTDWGGGVWALPGWREGAFEVQDEGSQLIALACEISSSRDRVLDLCAGNGGKTLAIAAMLGDDGADDAGDRGGGHVCAQDIDGRRLKQVYRLTRPFLVSHPDSPFATPPIGRSLPPQLAASAARARVAGRVRIVPPEVPLDRIDPPSRVVEGGGARDGEGVGGTPLSHDFDLVLVDAPCSSSGVLRRHPGLRWGGGWDGASLSAMARLQLSLLLKAAALVAPGGRLVYATCSLLEVENERVAEAFELAEGGAEWARWALPETFPGRGREGEAHMSTLWPQRHGTDGFFLARWRRRQ